MNACKKSDLSMVKLLASYKCDVNIRNTVGQKVFRGKI